MTAPRGGLGGFVASYWTPAGRHALRNLVGLIACTGVSQACGLGVLLILTHGLSQAAFGAVMLALNVQTYLLTIGTFGLSAVVIRDLVREPDKADEIVTAYFTIVGAASVLSGGLVAAAAAVLPLSADERVLLWCVSAGNVFACLNLNPLFDAVHRQALAAALMVPADVLALAATAGLHATGSLTAATAALVLLSKWALTAAAHALTFRSIGGYHFKTERPFVGRMVRSGRPLAVAAILVYVPLNGGVAATRATMGDAETGVYGMASQAALVSLLMSGLIVRVIQPHIAGPHGLDRSFVVKLAVFLALAFSGLWAGYAVVMYTVVLRLLPPHYNSVTGPALVLGAAAELFAVASILGTYLVRFGLERTVRTSYAVTCGLYLLSLATRPENPLEVSLLTLGAAVGLVTLLSLKCVAISRFT